MAWAGRGKTGGSYEVVRYIDDQEKHHQKVTFQEELREFLRRHAVEFDERFLWD
ncbi:MAG: hypothetical protein ACE5JX_18150 [Acidobacteriota bacterium]